MNPSISKKTYCFAVSWVVLVLTILSPGCGKSETPPYSSAADLVEIELELADLTAGWVGRHVPYAVGEELRRAETANRLGREWKQEQQWKAAGLAFERARDAYQEAEVLYRESIAARVQSMSEEPLQGARGRMPH
ncbi:MAG: hypothetical protein JJU36_11470 [Phycisphaeraceae bacterium]|nr:hypothetical protein [Phycisphaeraceae bacterium]